MGHIKELLARLNRAQDRHRLLSVSWGVQKKFSDDQANLLVVALGWYGFTAIYPLILVVVTVFGFIGAGSLGTGVVDTLHKFPVIGSDLGSHGSTLHGSVLGLVVGVVGALYGAQGVTQVGQTAMNRVWDVRPEHHPGFLPRLLRSLGALGCIGLAFLGNAVLGSISAGNGRALVVRILLIVGQLILNLALYLGAFRLLLAPGAGVSTRKLLPGVALAAVAFTALITIGAGLVQHQLRHSSNTYGAFASVIGVVAFLLLLSKLTIYAAELNPVMALELHPRALPTCDPMQGDLKADRLKVEAATDPSIRGTEVPTQEKA